MFIAFFFATVSAYTEAALLADAVDVDVAVVLVFVVLDVLLPASSVIEMPTVTLNISPLGESTKLDASTFFKINELLPNF